MRTVCDNIFLIDETGVCIGYYHMEPNIGDQVQTPRGMMVVENKEFFNGPIYITCVNN